MDAQSIQQALTRAWEVQQNAIDRRRFRGYSGKARAASGLAAIAAAAIMALPHYPATPQAHLFGWAAVFVVSVSLNFGAVFHWFWTDAEARRDWRRLKPALDSIPALVVGGLLTFALIQAGQYRCLFGAWMCLFGLSNIAGHQVLPRAIWPLGLFYIVCGGCALVLSGITFLDPWPMGLAFGIGELAGGVIFHRNRIAAARPRPAIASEGGDLS